MGNATMFGRVGAWLSIALVGLAACWLRRGDRDRCGGDPGLREAALRGHELSAARSAEARERRAAPARDAAATVRPAAAREARRAAAPARRASVVTGAVPTELAQFPCTVCRRAENCCRAEGLTDCGYTAACASATNAQQMEFYLVLCRAVLDASSLGR